MLETKVYDFLTSNQELKNLDYYQTIAHTLSDMVSNGVLQLTGGYCLTTSSMIQTALFQQNIESYLLEVELVITYQNHNQFTNRFVGFDKAKNQGEMDTHIVVITKTPNPILIDASIWRFIPQDSWAIIDAFNKTTPDRIIGNYVFPYYNISLIYKEKTKQPISESHYTSIINRINTDKSIFKKLKWLTIVVIILLSISGLNFIRGVTDMYLVYIEQNYWGPATLKKMSEQIDNIEKKVHQLENNKK